MNERKFFFTTTSSEADESGVIDEFAVVFALESGRGDGVDDEEPHGEVRVYHSHFPNRAPTVKFAEFPAKVTSYQIIDYY